MSASSKTYLERHPCHRDGCGCDHTEKIEPHGWPLGPANQHRAAAFYRTTEAVLLHRETRQELARVPWWAGDDAVEEGDPVTVQGQSYRITAWGGRCVGRPAYVFVEPCAQPRAAPEPRRRTWRQH